MIPAPRWFNAGAMLYLREARTVPVPMRDAAARVVEYRFRASCETLMGHGLIAAVYVREADEIEAALERAMAWAQSAGGAA